MKIEFAYKVKFAGKEKIKSKQKVIEFVLPQWNRFSDSFEETKENLFWIESLPELKSYPWEIKGDWCKKSEEKFSGRYSMGIVRGSQYSEIVSSMTDLPQVSYLSFWIKYNLTETDGQYYCCYVQISLDGGKTWHDIEPIGGYPGVRPDIRVENNILYPKKKKFLW